MTESTLPPSVTRRSAGRDDRQVPGVVVVFSAGAAASRALALDGGPLELGRGDGPGRIDDGRISRRHVRVELDAGRWIATDLGSQNGTFIDAEPAHAQAPRPVQRVLRIGDTLIIPCADVRPFARDGVGTLDGLVRGPTMRAVLEEAAAAARAGTTLHVRGETGTGKEGIAQAFHRGGPRGAGPLVAVNCAAIPASLAERLLFGAKRGAYSGAETDAAGYLQEADGGTLFLDEIAELDIQVQAKLLRALESKEILPLGASKPRRIDVALCTAATKDLRALVATGAWREDLYFRIGRPSVIAPPLRDRPEEIPALIAHELARTGAGLTPHVSLVEQCLLRPWPGNVRELLSEIRIAAHAARAGGCRVDAHHLGGVAGTAFGSDAGHGASDRAAGGVSGEPDRPPAARDARVAPESREAIEQALRDHAGNVTATARALGLHRTQLRRLIERHGIATAGAAGGGDDRPGE